MMNATATYDREDWPEYPVIIQAGNSRLRLDPRALKLQPLPKKNTARVIIFDPERNRRHGIWGEIPMAEAEKLVAAGVELMEPKPPPKRRLKWTPDYFKISVPDGQGNFKMVPVHGLTCQGWGIAQRHVDEDGAAIEDWNVPPRALTHLLTGGCWDVNRHSVNVLKRKAERVIKAAPEAAQIDPRAWGQELKEAAFDAYNA